MTPDLQTDRTQTTLIIPNLQSEEDEGEYRCKARNVWGEVNETFPVIVKGKTSNKCYTLWTLSRELSTLTCLSFSVIFDASETKGLLYFKALLMEQHPSLQFDQHFAQEKKG